MSLPRKTIGELVALYKVEPSLRDVYVEGLFDKSLISWLFRKLRKNNVCVYEINCVDISDVSLARYSLTRGRRQEVQVLSYEIAADKSQLVCVIDSDLDFVLGDCKSSDFLLKTDYSSIETYFYSEEFIVKFFEVVIGDDNPLEVASELLGFMEGFLTDFFFIRAAIGSLKLNFKLIDCVNELNKEMVLDVDLYIEKLINKNAYKGGVKSIRSVYDSLKSKNIGLDRRKRIHGHDFISTFHKLMSKSKKFDAGSSDAMAGAIFGTADIDLILAENLFDEICKRLL